MRSYSRDKNAVLKVCSFFCLKNVVLNLSATKDVVLKVCALFCGLKNVFRNECYQTCGLYSRDKNVL